MLTLRSFSLRWQEENGFKHHILFDVVNVSVGEGARLEGRARALFLILWSYTQDSRLERVCLWSDNKRSRVE